jgi:hypothetical protein
LLVFHADPDAAAKIMALTTVTGAVIIAYIAIYFVYKLIVD